MNARSPRDYLPLAEDVVMILLVLADGPRHGYGIMQDVERRSAGDTVLQTGALYRHLKRLLHDRLIHEVRPPRGAGDDERRRFYAVTPLGRDVLAAEMERMARLVRAGRSVVATRPRLA